MELPATETNGVIEANASPVEISSQWMANGASGDNMGNVRELAAVVSRKGSANAIIHPRRTTVVIVSAIESNIAAVVPRNVHREALISGSYYSSFYLNSNQSRKQFKYAARHEIIWTLVLFIRNFIYILHEFGNFIKIVMKPDWSYR